MGRFAQTTVPVETQIEFHGNHTTVAYVILTLPDGQRLFTGVAKRNPVDKYDPEVGGALAIGRAFDAAARFLNKRGGGLVKHHDDMRTRNLKREAEGRKAVAKNLQQVVETAKPVRPKKAKARIGFGVSPR
jgi:hypothetical protein